MKSMSVRGRAQPSTPRHAAGPPRPQFHSKYGISACSAKAHAARDQAKLGRGQSQGTACRTGTCLGRDCCHALLGPHTVALSANSDTCGDEDMPQAQGGDDASTEPPHSHVCLAEGQSSSARITPDPPRSPGQADSRMLQLLLRIVAWRKDSPVATPSQSTTPRWSPVFTLPRLCSRWRRVGTPDCAPWGGRFGKERGCAEPSAA